MLSKEAIQTCSILEEMRKLRVEKMIPTTENPSIDRPIVGARRDMKLGEGTKIGKAAQTLGELRKLRVERIIPAFEVRDIARPILELDINIEIIGGVKTNKIKGEYPTVEEMRQFNERIIPKMRPDKVVDIFRKSREELLSGAGDREMWILTGEEFNKLVMDDM